MSKTKTIDKPFILSDSGINEYGFRLMTEGFVKEEFLKSPIGFYMHKRDDGVAVRWTDLSVSGDKITAKPVVNLSNARGQQIVDEIENGFLNAASVGGIVVLESCMEEHPSKPGEKILTVTKWFCRECSVVDIPANRGSFKLYDALENEINLADLMSSQKSDIMDKVTLNITPDLKAKLNITAAGVVDATSFEGAINDLASANTSLTNQVAVLKSEKKTVEKELADLKAGDAGKKVKELLDEAQKPGQAKITNATRAKLQSQFADNPDGLKDLLDTLPVQTGIVEKLKQKDASGATGDAQYKKLADLSYEQMLEQDLAETCLNKYPELAQLKYDEAYGDGKFAAHYPGHVK